MTQFEQDQSPFSQEPLSLRQKLHTWWLVDRQDVLVGLRMTVISVTPLIVATALKHLTAGSNAFLSGLYTSLADTGNTYKQRAIAMGLATLGMTITAFGATLFGNIGWLTIVMALICIFSLSMLGVYGNVGSKVSFVITGIFIIFSGQPGTLPIALERGMAFLAGGLWAMLVSLRLWPFRPYQPIRDAVAGYYRAICTFIMHEYGEAGYPQRTDREWVHTFMTARTEARTAQIAAHDAVMRFRSGQSGSTIPGRQLFFLTQEADRFFEEVIAISKSTRSMAATEEYTAIYQQICTTIRAMAQLLLALASGIAREKADIDLTPVEQALHKLVEQEKLERQNLPKDHKEYVILLNIRHTMYIIQQMFSIVRSAVSILQHPGNIEKVPGEEQYSINQLSLKTILQTGWDTLRAHITPYSLIFRHALRLSVAATLGISLYTILHIPFGYWIPLTILFILKPEFSGTSQRTAQRLIGTILGGIVASFIIATVHNMLIIGILLGIVGFCSFVYTTRNYGIFVLFLTPFVVFMIDLHAPGDWRVALIRIINTLIGGFIAFLAGYLFWPQWEHERIASQLARTITANKAFFHYTMQAYLGRPETHPLIIQASKNAHLETVNASAAFQRQLREPKHRQGNIEQSYALTAYSQQLCDSITVLATHIPVLQSRYTLPGLQAYVDEITAILTQVVNVLREVQNSMQPSALLEEYAQKVQKELKHLVEVRMSEITTELPHTTSKKVLEDLAPLYLELERITTNVVAIQHVINSPQKEVIESVSHT